MIDKIVKLFQSTPSARRATGRYRTPDSPRRISIHALREEGDYCFQDTVLCKLLFQSTPSARRATAGPGTDCRRHLNFNPRPPRGGRRVAAVRLLPLNSISIHALREEGDQKLQPSKTPSENFNPRPPRGGRPTRAPTSAPSCNFNPRPPRGGRRV